MVRKLFILSAFLLVPFTAFGQFETDTSEMRNPEHISIADQLAQDLTTRLTLTSEQSNEIKEILIDYQEEFSGIKSAESAEEMNDQFEQNDVMTDTSEESDDMFETDTDVKNETETDISTDTSTETGVSAQDKANSAIEEVLNDTQKTTWAVIKDAWWRDVNSRYGWENKLENQE